MVQNMVAVTMGIVLCNYGLWLLIHKYKQIQTLSHNFQIFPSHCQLTTRLITSLPLAADDGHSYSIPIPRSPLLDQSKLRSSVGLSLHPSSTCQQSTTTEKLHIPRVVFDLIMYRLLCTIVPVLNLKAYFNRCNFWE